jgi:hypothetical protein
VTGDEVGAMAVGFVIGVALAIAVYERAALFGRRRP